MPSASPPPHLVLDETASIALAAVTLALIGGVYIGFAALEGRALSFAVECAVAAAFALAALAGLLWSPWAIPAALAAHAVWDLIHHSPAGLLARPPAWYPPFCAVVDLLLPGFVAASRL